MSFIGKNIKKIRSVKRLNQQAFADIFGLSRANVGSYEEGRAEPKIDTIIKIANYFSISLELLLSKELTVNELYRFNIFKTDTEKEKDHTTKYEQAKNQEKEIPFVANNIDINYLANYHEEDFIAGLAHLKLPVEAETKLRAFEHNGNEMQFDNHGIVHGDILVCAQANLKEPGKLVKNHVYVFVTKEKIFTRRLASAGKSLGLKADNQYFDPIDIDQKDILEAWEVKGIYSTNVQPPLLLEERVMELERKFEGLEKTLDKKK